MEGRKYHKSGGSTSSRSRKRIHRHRILLPVFNYSDDEDDYQVIKKRSKRRSNTAPHTLDKEKHIKTKRCGPKKNVWESSSSGDDADQFSVPEQDRFGTNVMTTAPKEATAETVVPVIESVTDVNQTVLLDTAGLAEPKDTLNQKTDESNIDKEKHIKTKLHGPKKNVWESLSSETTPPERENVTATKEATAGLAEPRNTLLNQTSSPELVNYISPRNKGLVHVERDDVLPSTDRIESANSDTNRFDSPSCSLDNGSYFSPRNKRLVDAKGDGVLPNTDRDESNNCCGHEQLVTLVLKEKVLVKDENQDLKANVKQLSDAKQYLKASIKKLSVENQDLKESLKQLSDENQDLKASMKELSDGNKDLKASMKKISDENHDLKASVNQLSDAKQDLKARVKQLYNENQDLKESVKQLSDGNKDMKASMKQLSHDKEILLKTKTEEIDDLKAEMSLELDEVRTKLHEKEKLLIEVQCERDTLEKSLTTQKQMNTKREQDIAEVKEDLLKRTSEVESLSQRETQGVKELESKISILKEVNAKQEQDLTEVREDLLKRTIEIESLSQRESQRVKEMELMISTLKEINAKQDQYLTEVRDDLVKLTTEIELLIQRESERVKEMESEILTLKEISAKQQQELTNVREDLLKRTNENEMLTQRGNKAFSEVEFEMSTLEDNLKSSIHLCNKIMADLTSPTPNSMEVLELVEAHEFQNKETDKLQGCMGDPGEELISKKDCELRRESEIRPYNAVEEVELDYCIDNDGSTHYESNVNDKRNLEIGTSDARAKSKTIPNIYSVDKRTSESTSKPTPAALECKEIICLSDEEDLSPMKKNRDCLPISKTTDPEMEFLCRSLESRDGNCVIWTVEGRSAKITAGDALKVLNNESLTSEIIDSWGELLIQHLHKKRKMTSTFIFTSRIGEVVGWNGGSSSIQKIVDSHIRKAVESDILVLPVFMCGAASALEHVGCYWTLLKYDVRSSTWTFFNSMQPQYMVEFKPCFPVPQLMEYMEERMIPVLRDLRKNSQLITKRKQKSSIVPFQQITPPQGIAGSLDCGVIVCHIMEKILKGQAVSTIRTSNDGAYGASKDAKYRRRMVESFLSPDNIKDMEE